MLEPNSLYLLFGDIDGVGYNDHNILANETYSIKFSTSDSLKFLPGTINKDQINRSLALVTVCETLNEEALVRFVANIESEKITRLQVRYITVKLR